MSLDNYTREHFEALTFGELSTIAEEQQNRLTDEQQHWLSAAKAKRAHLRD